MKPLNRQEGAVLVVALVLLLVMSLIGLSSVVSSTLQEKMASNAQQRTLARANAEVGLVAAETFLTNNIKSSSALASFNGGTLGLYSAFHVNDVIASDQLAPRTNSLADESNPALWTNANSVEVLNLSDKVKARNPRYVIEYVGRRSQSGTPVWSPSGPIERGAPHLFKITAIGWSRDTGVYSVLQSHYMTGTGAGVFVYED